MITVSSNDYEYGLDNPLGVEVALSERARTTALQWRLLSRAGQPLVAGDVVTAACRIVCFAEWPEAEGLHELLDRSVTCADAEILTLALLDLTASAVSAARSSTSGPGTDDAEWALRAHELGATMAMRTDDLRCLLDFERNPTLDLREEVCEDYHGLLAMVALLNAAVTYFPGDPDYATVDGILSTLWRSADDIYAWARRFDHYLRTRPTSG